MKAWNIHNSKDPTWIIPRDSYMLWTDDEREIERYDFVVGRIDDRYEEI